MEQCTECGSYRARDAKSIQYVVPGKDNSGDTLPDPDAGDDGSVWGPHTDTESDDSRGW